MSIICITVRTLKKSIFFTLALFIFSQKIFCQTEAVVSGRILDKSTKEAMQFANLPQTASRELPFINSFNKIVIII